MSKNQPTTGSIQLSRDRRIARQILSGDERALTDFVNEYFPRLYRYARHRLRSEADVEDVVQVALTQAARRLEPEATEYKYYLAGTGFVQAIALEDGEIVEDSSEWLVCTGDSLDVLSTPACGFGDSVDELLQQLCNLHDAFCDAGE